jgi:hypothetical protein
VWLEDPFVDNKVTHVCAFISGHPVELGLPVQSRLKCLDLAEHLAIGPVLVLGEVECIVLREQRLSLSQRRKMKSDQSLQRQPAQVENSELFLSFGAGP